MRPMLVRLPQGGWMLLYLDYPLWSAYTIRVKDA